MSKEDFIFKQSVPNWQQDKHQEILKTPVFSIEQKRARLVEAQKEGVFYVMNAPPWVNVIGLTRSNEIILVEQYRHGTREVTWELPGGVSEMDEDPVEAASRELQEETGFATENTEDWSYLGYVSSNPAIINNYTHLYLAHNCEKLYEVDRDELEYLEVHLLSIDDFKRGIRNHFIHHSLVVAAFSKLVLHYPEFLC